MFNPPPCACAALAARSRARNKAVGARRPALGARARAMPGVLPLVGMVDLPVIVMC